MAPVETESVSLIIASQITKSLTGAFLFIAVIVLLIYCWYKTERPRKLLVYKASAVLPVIPLGFEPRTPTLKV